MNAEDMITQQEHETYQALNKKLDEAIRLKNEAKNQIQEFINQFNLKWGFKIGDEVDCRGEKCWIRRFDNTVIGKKELMPPYCELGTYTKKGEKHKTKIAYYFISVNNLKPWPQDKP